jgi:hypothetical protein
LKTIRSLENVRRKFVAESDKGGLRELRQTAVEGKKSALKKAAKPVSAQDKLVQTEIADWITIWLQTPELFESWVGLRQKSKDFLDRFGEPKDK